MEKALSQILETQNQILKTLQQHGEQLQSLEKGQHRLEIRLETEAFDKIAVLFDGHKTLQETLADHTERLQRIEDKVADHDVQIRVLGRTKRKAKS